MNIKKIILIPSYEPDSKLVNLTIELSKEDVEILIVDDGSGKKYSNIFDKCKNYADIISYEENKGKGFALKTGLNHIKKKYKNPYIIVTMDSDGQHTIRDAKKLINECIQDKSSLYLGKRIRSKKTPIRSRIGNSITSLIFNLVAGTYIYDTQTGLRVFSDELIDYLINIDGDRFEYEMNVLLSCAKDKVKMKETEIETIYIDNNSSSHFNAVKDSYRIYKNIIKYSLKK